MTANLLVSFHLLLLLAVLTTSLPCGKAPKDKPRCQCLLPSTWVADYKWSNGAAGKVIRDHMRQLLVTSEDEAGRFQYHLKLSEGTHMYYGSASNGYRHYVFSRPLNILHDRCLTSGRASRDGKRLRFDVEDSRRIPVTSCAKNLLHTLTKMTLWVAHEDCRPVELELTFEFEDAATRRKMSVIPSRFYLSNLQSRNLTSAEERLTKTEMTANRC